MQFYQNALAKFNNSTPKQKNYLSLGLTIGLLIILLALIFPAVNHILKINKEIADGEKVERKLYEKIIALDKAEENFNTSKDRLVIVSEALPTGSDVDTHLRQVERLAAKSNATLSGIQFSDVPLSLPTIRQNLAVKQVEYSITVSGGFANISNFISDLENAVRTVDITTISISEDGTILTASLNVITNYLGQPTARSKQLTTDGQDSGKAGGQ